MGKGSKGKPLYDDDDRDGNYLVIANPWGMDIAGHRTQTHVDYLGAWLHRMFNGKATAEVVNIQDTVRLSSLAYYLIFGDASLYFWTERPCYCSSTD